MKGKGHRADDDHKIGRGNARSTHAKQPQAHQRHHHAKINVGLRALAKAQSDQGDKYNIQRRDEGILAGRGDVARNAELLQDHSSGEQQTAAHTAKP